jgi:hypothetical protein
VDGDAGRGVAVAEAIVKWFRLFVRSFALGVGGGGAVNVAWGGSSRMEGSMTAIEVAFERESNAETGILIVRVTFRKR